MHELERPDAYRGRQRVRRISGAQGIALAAELGAARDRPALRAAPCARIWIERLVHRDRPPSDRAGAAAVHAIRLRSVGTCGPRSRPSRPGTSMDCRRYRRCSTLTRARTAGRPPASATHLVAEPGGRRPRGRGRGPARYGFSQGRWPMDAGRDGPAGRAAPGPSASRGPRLPRTTTRPMDSTPDLDWSNLARGRASRFPRRARRGPSRRCGARRGSTSSRSSSAGDQATSPVWPPRPVPPARSRARPTRRCRRGAAGGRAATGKPRSSTPVRRRPRARESLGRSSGNDSTSVGPSLPMCSTLSSASSASSDRISPIEAARGAPPAATSAADRSPEQGPPRRPAPGPRRARSGRRATAPT